MLGRRVALVFFFFSHGQKTSQLRIHPPLFLDSESRKQLGEDSGSFSQPLSLRLEVCVVDILPLVDRVKMTGRE